MLRLARRGLCTGGVGASGHFLGAPASQFTPSLHFFRPHKDALPATMPSFRLIDDEGVPLEGAALPELSQDLCVEMMETMVRVNEFDKVFYDAQRQGRLSFYFTNRGEEAMAVGSAAALKPGAVRRTRRERASDARADARVGPNSGHARIRMDTHGHARMEAASPSACFIATCTGTHGGTHA